MEPRIGSKLKIIYIIDILKEFSDEQNPLTATEICEQLAKRGVRAERKAIYDDIEILRELGYKINDEGYALKEKGWDNIDE
jgi:Fe2+ or Zn2+ uptake regulation protein